MYELCAIILLPYIHPRGCIIPSLLIEPSMQQAGLWLIPVASSNTFALLTWYRQMDSSNMQEGCRVCNMYGSEVT